MEPSLPSPVQAPSTIALAGAILPFAGVGAIELPERAIVALAVVIAVAAISLRLGARIRAGRAAHLAVFGLLVFAAAARPAFIRASGPGRDVLVVLVDLSRSRGPDPGDLLAPAAWGIPDAEAARAARWIVIGFGADAVSLADGADRPSSLVAPNEAGARSFRAVARLDRAIALATALLEPGDRAHLMVITDGGLDMADVLARIDATLPFESAAALPGRSRIADDAAVRFVTASLVLQAGETPAVEVEVFGRVAVPRSIAVRLDEGPPVSVVLGPKVSSARVSLRPAPVVEAVESLSVRLEGNGAWDGDPSNDQDVLPIHVRRARPRVQVMADDEAEAARIAGILGSLGLADVKARSTLTATEVGGGADVVVIANVGAFDLERTRRIGATLERHVLSGGGALLAGARASFGAGRWEKTIFDDLSPLKADPGSKPLRVTVCLDRSGSMAAEHRFDAARRAAVELYERLSPADEMVVLAFSTEVVRLRKQGGGDAGEWARLLEGLRPEGGTDLPKVLDLALREPAPPETASVILLLTDGRGRAGDLGPDRLAAWQSMARAGGHTVHVFWFDREEELRAPLERLAHGTGGALVPVDDFAALLKPFLRATRPDLEVAGAVVHDAAGRTARLDRLLRTRSEDGVDVIWALDGRSAALAAKSRGAGRIAAAPFDLTSENVAAIWETPAAFGAFVATLAPPGIDRGAAAEIERDGSGWRWVVSSPGLDANANLAIECGGRTWPLDPIGPEKFASRRLLDPPDSAAAVISDSGKPVRRVAVRGPDLSDREPEPGPARIRLLDDALARRATGPVGRGLDLDLIRLLAVLLLVADIIMRVKRR